MSVICSCFRADCFVEYVNPSGSVYRNCPCLRCLVHNFLHLYIALFRRGETCSLPSALQAAASITSVNNSLSDADENPRYFLSQRDCLVSRRDKGSSHSHEEAEPLRIGNEEDSESFEMGGRKWVNKTVCDTFPRKSSPNPL